jgi:hypothetical protein
MFLLKNFGDLNAQGVTVMETSSSQHDSPRISEMFLLMKNNNRKKFFSFIKLFRFRECKRYFQINLFGLHE